MSVYISVELKRQVRERFANCCAFCHTAEDLTVAIFELEHILPRSAGGETVFQNLCLVCPTCNRYKSDLTYRHAPIVAMRHSERRGWANDCPRPTEYFGAWHLGLFHAPPQQPAIAAIAEAAQGFSTGWGTSSATF